MRPFQKDMIFTEKSSTGMIDSTGLQDPGTYDVEEHGACTINTNSDGVLMYTYVAEL
jgi:hypothetical protein